MTKPATDEQVIVWEHMAHSGFRVSCSQVISLIARIELEADCLKSFEEHHVAQVDDALSLLKEALPWLETAANSPGVQLHPISPEIQALISRIKETLKSHE